MGQAARALRIRSTATGGLVHQAVGAVEPRQVPDGAVVPGDDHDPERATSRVMMVLKPSMSTVPDSSHSSRSLREAVSAEEAVMRIRAVRWRSDSRWWFPTKGTAVSARYPRSSR